MRVDEAIRSLRATRRYGTAPIADDLVIRWVDAARWCGSSKNSQPWRFVAVRDRDVLRQLSTFGDFAGHLAHCELAVVVLSGPTPYPFSRAFDLGRVTQCLMLLAQDDGFGSCVAVFEPADHVSAAGDLIRAPEGWSAELAIGFGVPGDDRAGGAGLAPSSPPGRLPTAELLHWARFPEGDHAVR